MKRKHKKQVRVAMTITLAATSIAYYTGSLFAQSGMMKNEYHSMDIVNEEVREENTRMEDLETVVENSLESKENMHSVEKAVADVAINEVHFPDAEFRNYLSNNFDTNRNGILSNNEINNVAKIIMGYNKNLISDPVSVGSYKEKAILESDKNFLATEVEKEWTVSKAMSTITILDDLNKMYDRKPVSVPQVSVTGSTGSLTFEWYTADGQKLSVAPANAGSYKIKVILAGDGNYDGVEVEKAFTITKAISTIAINGDLNKVYNGVPMVGPSITTVGSTGGVAFEWYTADGTRLQTAPVNAGNYKIKAILAESANFSGAEIEKAFVIAKANSTITINDDLNKVYDEQAVVAPTDIVTTGSTGTVSMEWYTTDGQKLQAAPVNAGSYKVKAILAGDSNHNGTEIEKEFEISKASNKWKQELTMQDWVYGEIANTPSAEAQFGTVEFTYSTSEDGVYTADISSDAGTYWVKATVTGTNNYEGLEAKKPFTIGLASSIITIDNDLSKLFDGIGVANPQVTVIGSTGSLTFEWYKKEESTTRAVTWVKLAEAPSEVGNYKVVVTVAGDRNYTEATAEKEFSILENTIVVPTPGAGGTVSNPSGGTVNRPDGVTETIQPGGVLIPNKPEQSVTGVQTGDGTQVGLWTMLVGLSIGMVMYFRRKNGKAGV